MWKKGFRIAVSVASVGCILADSALQIRASPVHGRSGWSWRQPAALELKLGFAVIQVSSDIWWCIIGLSFQAASDIHSRVCDLAVPTVASALQSITLTSHCVGLGLGAITDGDNGMQRNSAGFCLHHLCRRSHRHQTNFTTASAFTY